MKRFIRQLVVIGWAVAVSGGFLMAFAQSISQSLEIEQPGEQAVSLIAVQVADEVGDRVDELPEIDTVTAELKPVVAYESFAGVFESTRAHEVRTEFEVWTDLVIDSAVSEGTATMPRKSNKSAKAAAPSKKVTKNNKRPTQQSGKGKK